MPFNLYLDADGKPKIDDKGRPYFIQDGASEPVVLDVNEMIDTNRQKHTSAEAAKKELAEAVAKLNAFDGLSADEARKALELVKTIDEGKMVEAGKLEELKRKYAEESAQKVNSLEKALEEAKNSGAKAVADKEQMIHGLLVENAFSGSQFLREKTVLPPDFAYASMGKNFAVEYHDGKPIVIAKDGKGNPIFSPAIPSAYASPEEAIKILIEQHPQRDSLLKAPAPNGGSGQQPGGRAGISGTSKKLTDCKTEAEKVAWLKAQTA